MVRVYVGVGGAKYRNNPRSLIGYILSALGTQGEKKKDCNSCHALCWCINIPSL